MKKLFMLMAIATVAIGLFAQVPQKMSYQCIVRDANGAIVANQGIGIKISILQGSSTGNIIYQETYNPNPQTNGNGLVSIEIGSGIVIIGNFSTIDWSAGPYFLKTETDPTGATNYSIAGTSQLLSVPYAIYAKTAGNGFSGDYYDLTNKPILFSGNYTDLTNKPLLFDGNWTNIFGKPTSVSGYGITDAVTTSGDQTIEGNKTFTGIINASSHKVTNVADPVNEQDAATKAYVDALKQKISEMEGMLASGGLLTVTDIDGNIYKTIKIGLQVWMSENLKTTRFRNGDSIDYQWPYDGNDDNTSVYGKLYSFDAALRACPTGWHLPSDLEWGVLKTFLGGASVAGGKMKEAGLMHWIDPNTGATNESGFTALPGGYKYGNPATTMDGESSDIGVGGYWWSSTTYNSSPAQQFRAVVRKLSFNSSQLFSDYLFQQYGLSVRCIKNYKLPHVSTINVTDITSTTATSGGIISNDSGSKITERGVLLHNPNDGGSSPILYGEDDVWPDQNGTGTGTFINYFTNLVPNNTYYLRAYAITDQGGISYGDVISFTTLSK